MSQTKEWWLEEPKLIRLDGPKRRELARRNRSAINLLEGLGTRAPAKIPTVTPLEVPVEIRHPGVILQRYRGAVILHKPLSPVRELVDISLAITRLTCLLTWVALGVVIYWIDRARARLRRTQCAK